MLSPTEIMYLKETQWFIKFTSVCLNILNFFLSAENNFFYLKYPFCRPLDSAARGGSNTSAPATSLILTTLKIYQIDPYTEHVRG
jgi:hypothetical protein